MKYQKINKNSLGQFLKTRIKWFWVSNWIKPSFKHTKKSGVVVNVPASIKGPGLTYVNKNK